MVPVAVRSRQPLVYWKASPGLSSGWWPTTPRPFTSSISPAELEMIQWREISWAATSPVLVIVMVYAKLNKPSAGADWSGRYWGSTSTRNRYLAMAASYLFGWRFRDLRESRA